MAEHRLHLKQMLGFSEVFIKKTEKWVWNSLGESIGKVKRALEKKLRELRANKRESQSLKTKIQGGVKRKVVYNNSSKKLSEEQMELLALGLSFGIAPKKFLLIEYVTAMEFLYQKLEECGDAESIEKARAIRNEVFMHLKRGHMMTLKSNLTENTSRIKGG